MALSKSLDVSAPPLPLLKMEMCSRVYRDHGGDLSAERGSRLLPPTPAEHHTWVRPFLPRDTHCGEAVHPFMMGKPRRADERPCISAHNLGDNDRSSTLCPLLPRASRGHSQVRSPGAAAARLGSGDAARSAPRTGSGSRSRRSGRSGEGPQPSPWRSVARPSRLP